MLVVEKEIEKKEEDTSKLPNIPPVDEEDWKIEKIDQIEVTNDDGPLPYVKSYSWDGELRIGWSRKMRT